MHYVLIDTFSAGNRGRQNDRGPSRDIGRVLSRHHSYEAAEREARRLNRAVKRGHGRNAYLPTAIRETRSYPPKGELVCEADLQ